MNGIAIYSGSTVIYWSGVVIALGVAACFALSYSLYTSYVGSGKALWVLLPLAVLFSVPLCRISPAPDDPGRPAAFASRSVLRASRAE